MRKILGALIVLLACAGMLSAQNSKLDGALDRKVRDFKKSGNSDRGNGPVKVIIQTNGDPDASGVSALIRGKGGRVSSKFSIFQGIAAELPLAVIESVAAQSAIARISEDAALINTASSSTSTTDINAFLSTIDVNRLVTGEPQVWFDYGVYGTGIGVAVVDSGISGSNDVYVKKDVDFTGTNTTTDKFGHGTHVAGILAGVGANSNYKFLGGSAGVNLVNLRVLDENGNGLTSNVIKAIEWAVTNRNTAGYDKKALNIRVINLSLGHAPSESAETDPLTIACRKAVNAGIVVVAAAGNYGKDSNGNTVYGGITSPGTEPSVITVGAMSTFDTLSRADDVTASYSSRGPSFDGLMKPDIAAPGTGIVAPSAAGNKLVRTYPQIAYDANYIRLSGTSMATPFVSAAAAMMLQKNPALKPNAVKALLMYSAEKRGNPLETGAGYLNALGAVNLAANVNGTAATSSYWLLNNGTGLKTVNEIYGGYQAIWGGTIIWDEALYTLGNAIAYNQQAWGSTVVWGDTIVWEDLMSMGSVSGTTIVWESDVSAFSTTVSGSTIVWEGLDAMSVEAKMFNVTW
jgi:serine protease AprX